MTKRLAWHLAPAMVLLASLTVVPRVGAGVIFYTNEATWLGAAGPLTGSEDFNSFLSDTEFRTTSVAASNMTISGGTGVNGSLTNKIDANPFEFSGFYAGTGTGTAYLLGDLDSNVNPSLRIDFTAGLSAWGADFQGIADGGRLTRLDVFDSSNGLLGSLLLASNASNSELQFYGLVLTGGDVAHHIIFTNASGANDVFRIDNIDYAEASAVPEPGTMILLASGLAGLAARRSRKRA